MTMRTNVRSQGAVRRAGGNTTEATTTTVGADTSLLAASSISIAAGEPILAVFKSRKSTGAAAAPTLGWKVNTTQVMSTALAPTGMKFGATNEAQDGFTSILFSAGATSYTRGLSGAGGSSGAVDNNYAALNPAAALTNALPAATITALEVTGNAVDALVTLGADELHVYRLAVAN